jgi:hypothetical protein
MCAVLWIIVCPYLFLPLYCHVLNQFKASDDPLGTFKLQSFTYNYLKDRRISRIFFILYARNKKANQ